MNDGARPGVPAVLLLSGLVAFYAAGNPLFFEWYWPSVFVPATLVTGLALRAAHHALLGRSRALATGVAAAGAVWLAIVTVLPYGAGPEDLQEPISVSQITADPTRLRSVGYQAVAGRLPPGARVLASEIGALGWAHPGPILDACGLVTPEALPYLPVPGRLEGFWGGIAPQFVEATRPDYVVSLPAFLAPDLLKSPFFRAEYELAWKQPLPLRCFGSSTVLVFRRRVAGS